MLPLLGLPVSQSTTAPSSGALLAVDSKPTTYSSTTAQFKPWWALDMKTNRKVAAGGHPAAVAIFAGLPGRRVQDFAPHSPTSQPR
jgi:hypothetical protein